MSFTSRAVLRSWAAGDVLDIHSHPCCTVHTLVIAGEIEEFTERMSGVDELLTHAEGCMFEANDCLGDHALRARVTSTTLEITVYRPTREAGGCVGCPETRTCHEMPAVRV
jgi:hypothetical protein